MYRLAPSPTVCVDISVYICIHPEIINIREHDIGHKIYLGKLLGSLLVPSSNGVGAVPVPVSLCFFSFLSFSRCFGFVSSDVAFTFSGSQELLSDQRREKIG